MKLGTYLQNKREKSGITLKEMERGSGIKRSVIQLIEAGDLNALPEPKHARFLLRKYADFLNLDAEQLMLRFESEMPEEVNTGKKRNQKSNKDFQYFRKVLLGFVTMVTVLFIVWLVLLQVGSQGEIFETKRVYDLSDETVEDVAEEAEPEKEVADDAESEEEPEPEPEEAAPTATVTFVNREGNTLYYDVTAPDELTLELAGDSSWISLTDDLENAYLYEESEGGSFDIAPDASIIHLALGNAPSFSINLNGEPVDNEPRGDSVTVYYQFNITRE